MALKVKEWKPVPGRPLPDPVIEDDRAFFPETIVRNILDWLEATKLTFRTEKPRGQTLVLANAGEEPKIRFGEGADRPPDEVIRGYGSFEFDHGSIELVLREKANGLVIAKYYYVVARTPDGKMIVGPQVNIVQTERVN